MRSGWLLICIIDQIYLLFRIFNVDLSDFQAESTGMGYIYPIPYHAGSTGNNPLSPIIINTKTIKIMLQLSYNFGTHRIIVDIGYFLLQKWTK